MREYFYHDENLIPIKIRASRKPSKETIPRRGTWIVKEASDGEWVMPCFPEITWGVLKTVTYLTSREIK